MTEENSFNGSLSNFEELNTTNHDIEQIKNIDNFLKCGICYEYFSTCVVTDCSHNFCSLCIRKYIQYKTECPVCFQQLYDSQLRANRIVDNIVNIFPDLKERIIHHLRTVKAWKSNCIYVTPTKKSDVSPLKIPSARKRNLRTPKNVIEKADEKESVTAVAESSQRTNVTADTSKVVIPKIFLSPLKRLASKVEIIPQKHVSCPVCVVDIPERHINAHLDDCLNRDKNKERNRKEHNDTSKRKHLPKFVYGLMTLSALRSKVKEQGLSTQGSFDALKSRLQRFTALYNAECDKTDPRPVQELIRQLEKEEKTLSSQKLSKNKLNVSRDDLPKEQQNEQYLKDNKDSFQKLVKNVKQRIEPKQTNEHDSKNYLTVCHCEPSTSKSSFDNFCNCDSDTKNWIEIEEHDIKIEPMVEVKKENLDEETPFIDTGKKIECEKRDDDDEVFSSKRCTKSKRNLFQTTSGYNLNSDEDDKHLIVSGNVVESSGAEIYSNQSEEPDSDDYSCSPVIKKGNAKKRSKKEVPEKNSRKRKK